MGRQCALRALGYPKRTLDVAPRVFQSLDQFFGYVMQDGRILRAERPYARGGGYGPWTLTPA